MEQFGTIAVRACAFVMSNLTITSARVEAKHFSLQNYAVAKKFKQHLSHFKTRSWTIQTRWTEANFRDESNADAITQEGKREDLDKKLREIPVELAPE